MRVYKTYLRLFMLLFAGLFCVALFLNIFLDPFQVYHESYLNKGHYIQDQDRFQNVGLINQLWEKKKCCKAILLGTSHSQNFDGEMIGEILGTGPILNLSMSGATPREELKLFQFVMETGRKPSYILWELHTPFTVSPLEIRDEKKLAEGKILPLYLYDRTIWNDAPYILSFDTLRFGIKQATSRFDLHDHKSWYSRNISSFEKGPEIFEKNLPLYKKKWSVGAKAPEDFESIKDVILPTVTANPDIKFVFFFPPYSVHFYAVQKQDEFANMMKFRQELVESLSKYENSEVFSFDLLDLGTDDLNQYKDIGHYHPDLGKKAIMAKSKGQGRLRAEEIQHHIRKFTERINAYCFAAGAQCRELSGE